MSAAPKQVVHPAPAWPADDAEIEERACWLLLTHAFYAAEAKVVDLYATDEKCRLSPQAFTQLFRSWYTEVVGPKGGRKKAFATSYWDLSPMRKNIRGVRMRPDMPFPLFEENGVWFKNLYRQPEHAGNGDVQPFLDFMARLLPDKRQREWFFDHMAHKQWKPWIPGQAVLFVADSDEGVREGTFGTGRGMLFKIAHKLYGENYAKAQSFDMIDASSSQCVFNDWIHNRILATIDEAKTSATAYRRGERSYAYDALKDRVDPSPKQMDFKVKHGQAFNDYSYCTFWVATNHANAVAIPREDRRFTVLKNGRKMTPEEAKLIVAWMVQPGNIAALSRWLAERDITNFSMFEPLDTDAKAEMAELARTPVEDALVELMEDDERGLVFARPHFEQAIEDHLCGNSGGLVDQDGNHTPERDRKHMPGYAWRGQLEGAWAAYITPLKTKTGARCKIRVNGRQMTLYCFRTRKQAAEKLSEAARRGHAVKWGEVDQLKKLATVGPLSGIMAGIAASTPKPGTPKT